MDDMDASYERLDSLWQQYLSFLDAYTTGQQQFRKHFVDGFFSLAQANARSSIRHGSDWYDNRTRATTKVIIEPWDQTERDGDLSQLPATLRFRTTEQLRYVPMAKDQAIEPQPDPSAESVQQPTPPGTPTKEETLADHEEAVMMQKQQKDPIFWFGLLPPSSLRSAQSSFKAGVIGKIPSPTAEQQQIWSPLTAMAEAARAMRVIEVEIKKLRKTVRQLERASDAAHK